MSLIFCSVLGPEGLLVRYLPTYFFVFVALSQVSLDRHDGRQEWTDNVASWKTASANASLPIQTKKGRRWGENQSVGSLSNLLYIHDL